MCSVCGDPTPQPQAQSLGSANTHSFSSLRDRGPSLAGLENGPAGASRQGKAGLEHSLFHPGRLPTPSSLQPSWRETCHRASQPDSPFET